MSEFLRNKPITQKKLRNWESLDIFLQSIFGDPYYKEVGMTRIKLEDFEMSKEDIIREATSAGFEVEDLGDTLVFR